MSKLVIYPNKILRVKTSPIGEVTAELAQAVDELTEVLRVSDNGAGLAATQLGMNMRFFGIKDPQSKKVKVFINPKMTKSWGVKTYPVIVRDDKTTEDFLEGCLSFPDYYGTVKRFLRINVVWQEIFKKKLVTKKKELSGFEAIVWQHEADHLDGVLFVDWVLKDGGRFYRWIGDKKEVWDVGQVVEGRL